MTAESERNDFEEVMVEFLTNERIPNLREIIHDDDKEKNFTVAAEYMPLKDSYSLQVNMMFAVFLELGSLANCFGTIVIEKQKTIGVFVAWTRPQSLKVVYHPHTRCLGSWQTRKSF